MKSYIYQNIKFLVGNDIKEVSKKTGISKEVIKEITLRIHIPTPEQICLFSDYFNISTEILLKKELKIKKNVPPIKFLVIDVDGVLTDGGMYYTEGGDEFKKFHTRDGMGIKNLTEKGFPVALLSSGFNKKIIQRRADLLKIKYVYVGTEAKLNILSKWCKQLKIKMGEVAYIGDDINDLEVIKKVGLSACPADAVDSIKRHADVITDKKGGNACVREFIDNWLLNTIK
ncbi:MAG: HAD-IIIA family hydrolase [Flavobacteriales bacterium]|nr:HAD-IIIA family hydrolase [Flavobacteriales bacterium]